VESCNQQRSHQNPYVIVYKKEKKEEEQGLEGASKSKTVKRRWSGGEDNQALRSQNISDCMIFTLNDESSGVIKLSILLIINPANEIKNKK